MEAILYSRSSEARDEVRDVCLALKAPDNAPALSLDGYSFAWSREGLLALRDIWQDGLQAFGSQQRSLPYASLRGLLEVMLPGISRVERNMCLDGWSLKRERALEAPPPFIWAEGDEDRLIAAAQHALDEWIPNYLVETFAKPGNISADHVERVRRLAAESRLLMLSRYKANILPWGWNDAGTTRNENADAFANLAHFVARVLATSKPLPGAGPLRRIVAVRDGRTGLASLVTDPISVEGKGAFSLVLQLEVVTFPGLHQPVVTIDVSKRRWLDALPDNNYLNGDVSGYAFPSDTPDRLPSFLVVRKRNGDGTFRWEPDNAFQALQRHFKLPLGKWSGDAIARGDASSVRCPVRLVHRPGLRDSTSQINVGVPEIDKLDAFEAVVELLRPYGLAPLECLSRVKTKHAGVARSSGMINAPTLLGAVLQSDDLDEGDRYTGDYLKELGDEEVDRLLRKKFQFGLASIHPRDKIIDSELRRGSDKVAKDQTEALQAMIDANACAVARLYGPAKPQLAILYDERATLSVKLLQSALRVLWRDALDVKPHRLPRNVHGPKDELPGAQEKATGRFRLRGDAWKPLAQSIGATKRQTLCLVVAPNFYHGDNGRVLPDDPVNKPATRKALSTFGGATVQFLLPVQQDGQGSIRLADYLLRVQAALKELVFAHAGRIDGVAAAATRCFGNNERSPREVIGITIVRQNRGRSRSSFEKTFLAIAARVDLATGRCDLRYAHERGGRLFISEWLPFTGALGEIAGASPVQLAENVRERSTRFMKFCEAVIGESVEAGMQPVVMIDSSNCARLWPWLADSRLDAARIDIAERQWMQEDWRGARIVRIRQDLAPGILRSKVTTLIPEPASGGGSGGRRRKKVRVPTSPFSGTLYRLNAENGSGCATYLSVGGKTLHHNKRGLSCYREALLPASAARASDGRRLFGLARFEPYTDQWPTPNPVEIVVTLRNADDDPDRIAEFAESLRHGFGHYGEWTSLPAPLFFERVVRDYICGFAVKDELQAEFG